FILGFVSAVSLYFLLPMTTRAETINRFPIIVPNSIEDSACYFKTSEGRTIALNSICGYKEPKEKNIKDRSQGSNSSNVSNVISLPIINPEFRPIVGANPGNPFGNNSGGNSNQCYIVDSEGNSCNSNPE
ncbi:MAG: hypothetical protein LH631_08105, partial [Alkalinema sp. CAN_BIN05]|nr:hypothetical protein [Alkalinema sp. CAN_BIN05]